MLQNKLMTKNVQKLLIIDADVLDADILLKGCKPDYQIIRLDPESEPVTQLTDAIHQHAPVQEIVLVAHGSPGRIHFTNFELNLVELEKHKSVIAGWQSFFTKDAKFCFYVCKLAAGKAGKTFLSKLNKFTDVTIAAATSILGNLGKKQNWDLDFFTYPFEVLLPFSESTIEDYPYALAPTLSFSIPFDDSTHQIDNDIQLLFDVTVVAGIGSIIISNGSDTRTIDVNDTSQVTINGGIVIINPATDLVPNTTYNIQMASGVITDTAGNAYAGISNPTTLDFTTTSPADPMLDYSDPSDGGTHQIDNDIRLTFNEQVVAGTGAIILSNGTDTRTIDINDAGQVTFDDFGNVIINPAADLVLNTTYNIQMASGVITDTAGNAYAGISDSTTLNFRTISTVPLLDFSSPFDGSTHQIDNDIRLIFNEQVIPGTGAIILSNGTDTRTIDVNDSSQVTFDDFGGVTINPATDLVLNTTYNIQMASGVITDTAGNVFSGISDSATLNFTTIPTDPLLTFSDPYDDSTLQVDNDIELYFNEQVIAGIGAIVISNGSDVRTIDINDTSQVTFDDFGVVTINPAADLVLNTTYNIQMANGVITDTAGNAYAGISNSTTLNFTSISSDPLLGFSDPFNGSTHQIDHDIELFFNETVVAGIGNIIISNGSDTRIIDVTDTNQVTFNDFGSVTINPIVDLLPYTTYNIQMASGVISDTAGNAYAGIKGPIMLNFTTISTEPLLDYSDPRDDSTHQVDHDIELRFNETVIAGSGNIIISNGSDTHTIDITDTSQVTFDNFGDSGVVTINPAADLALNTTYNIQMASGVITDTAGNVYAGISDPTTLNFTTIPSDPLLTSSDPYDDSTLQVDGDIELSFNELVVAGSGNIILSNGSDTRTININDTSQVTFDNFGDSGVVTINPATDLALNTTYNIQMTSGVITDTAGNAYAGISDPTALNFTTISSDPLLSFSDPFNGSTHQVDDDIQLFFNEPVVAGSGNIIIDNGSDTRTININDTSQVTFDDFGGVTINPAADLTLNTTYNIQMASGVITDKAGNAYAGISDPTKLNFTTIATIDNQGINLISGLGGAANFGEQLLSANDDDSTDFIDISSIFEDGINFFGRKFTGLWINNNGSVTFNGPREDFTPNVITSISDNPEISPYFADVDTRGGAVPPTANGNSTGSNLVYYDFDETNDRFIVTWDDVGYFGAHTDKLNAFQLILTDQKNGDFDIEFRYEDVNWTTGDASGGTGGLGFFGTAARAGFTAGTGDPAAFFELPGSGNRDAMLALDETAGNTGDIGRWLFNIRSADIPPLSINVGEDTSLDEGNTLTRTITFTDGKDTGSDGWTYSVDYGDGSPVETGSITTGANSFDISHIYADGDASHNVNVTVADTGNAADSDTKSFVLSVNNIAPTINLSGSTSVNEGETYTLNLSNLIDPGADTVSQYVVNWGDGSAATILTAAQLLAAGNNVTHVFADGASNPQITVDLVDEDGTHIAAGSLGVIVNNVAPTITVSGASEVDAGATYTFNLGAVTDPGEDTVTNYVVNWGDGSNDIFNAAGDVTHMYNTTGNATISVDLVDEDGTHTAAGTLDVTVNNVSPIAVKDSYTVSAGTSLTVNTDSGVLANDFDVEDNPITAQLINGTSNGILSLQADGSFTYTPNNGFSGIDTFTYRAFDGFDQSGDTSVTITVRQSPTGPEPELTGPSKQVNTFDEGDQITPSVTALSNGTFAVAWVSRGQDGDGDGIYGQIIDVDGNKIGSEFRLNATTNGDQQAPRLAALEGGGFVAVWDSFGQDGDKDAVIARRFANDGTPVGDEVLVNETSTSWQVAPDVIGLQEGGYAVVWQSEDQDGSFAGVYGRVFDTNDSPQTAELRLNEETAGYQSFPRIDQLEDGRLVAVWESEGQDGDGDGVFARIFGTDGVADGGEFQVNGYVPSYQSRPDVSALANGGFAIAWTSYGQDGDRNGVYTRAFNVDGTPAGNETQVAQNTRDSQEDASVAGLFDGTYLVGFTSDGEHNGIASSYMARFDASGLAQGGVVETTEPFTNNEARLGSIAITDDGTILTLNSVSGNDGGYIGASSAAVGLETSNDLQDSFRLLQSSPSPLVKEINTKPITYSLDSPVLLSTLAETGSSTNTEDTTTKENTIFLIGLGTSTYLNWLSELIEVAIKQTPSATLPGRLITMSHSIITNAVFSNEKGGLKIADTLINTGVSTLGGLGTAALAVGLGATPMGWVAITAGLVGATITGLAYSEFVNLEATIEKILQTGINIIDGAIEIGQSTIEFAEKLVNDLKMTMQEISADLKERLDQGIETTAETLLEVVGKIKAAAESVRDATLEGLKNATEAISGGFDVLSRRIKEGIEEFGEKIGELGKDIGDGLDVLKESFNDLIEAAQQLFDGANRPIDPIVLDLDRDGIELINVAASNARFDMDADGFAERTGWVAPDDAFLIYDRNGDGVVNDISEFFGSSGIDGFAELEGFDTNRDGVIAPDEPIWEQLKLWRDLNGDGNTDLGELTTLDAAGINQISVRTTEVRYSVEGNLIPYVTTFNDVEGEGLAGDVFFQVNQFDSAFNGNSTFSEDFTLDPEALLLPFLRGYGNVPDLYIEMSINPALKDLVVEFTQLLPEDHGRVRDLAEQIVYRWTRVETVAADSRGEFFNGQKLAVLEKIFGEPFDVSTRSGKFISNDPTTALMGQRLTQSWDTLFEGILNNLMVQIDFGGAFDNVVYDIATDAPLLLGSLDDVITAVAIGAPIEPIEAIGYWRLMSPILDQLKSDSNINDVVFKQILNDILAAQGITFTYDQLSNAVISEGLDDRELTGTELEELFVGSGANEDFSGGQGGDVYLLNAINWGQDRVVEVTARTDESEDDVIVLPEGVTLEDITLEQIPDGFILRRIGTNDEVIVQTVDLLGADGDFGVEILRFADGSEIQVAALLGEMTISAGENAVVNEGSTFTRTVEISDPVDEDGDGWTYQITWSDGVNTEGNVAAGETGFNITREFADDVGALSVEVSVADGLNESDTDRFNVLVVNVAPTITLNGNPTVNEGSTYTLTLGTITDLGTDTVTDYIINWGDGTTTALTAAELQALSDNVTHVYADGASNPLISVDLVDEDGTHSAAGTLNVTVNNVAPIIALSGASEINTNDTYTLNLGAITDPGDDNVTGYIVNWGDGSSDTYSSAGDVTHTYAAAGDNTITVDLIDEDGTHVNAATLDVTANPTVPTETILIGDAPLRVSRSDPNAWENAWTVEAVSISHKANYLDTTEAWSSASLNGRNSNVLNGGDIFGGDLGVSGQSLASSSIRQEIDGKEALRFDLDQAASKITIDLSRLDGNSSTGHFDAGRLQLLDDSGSVINELIFSADAASHEKQITLDHSAGFSSVVLTAGSYNGIDFVFGGLTDETGQFLSDPQDLGNDVWNASEYLVDAVEFEFGEITLVGSVA